MDFTLPTRWPLVPVDVAAFYLDRSPEAVIRDCDSLWAWDIAAVGSRRRQLRIWRQSLIAAKDPACRREVPDRLGQVLEQILPPRDLSGRELQQLLFCDRHLIRSLAAAGLLTLEREPQVRGGPTASRTYGYASIRKFLVTRALEKSVAPKIPPVPPLHPDAKN